MYTQSPSILKNLLHYTFRWLRWPSWLFHAIHVPYKLRGIVSPRVSLILLIITPVTVLPWYSQTVLPRQSVSGLDRNSLLFSCCRVVLERPLYRILTVVSSLYLSCSVFNSLPLSVSLTITLLVFHFSAWHQLYLRLPLTHHEYSNFPSALFAPVNTICNMVMLSICATV